MLHYPRRKLVMTHPVDLPGVGKIPFKEVEKEPLLTFWEGVIARKNLRIEESTRLLKVKRNGDHFTAETSGGTIDAAHVILAMGRRGTPRRLEVPGEELPKVAYRLMEAEAFDGQRVVVVGGGSAALEAAISIAERPRATVTICHRREEFTGARAALVSKTLLLEREGMIEVLRNAKVTKIEPAAIHFDVAGQGHERPNDYIFALIGGVPPSALLKDSGVDLETKFGTPLKQR